MGATPVQTVNGASANTNSIVLTSWTPASNDLLLLAVLTRQTAVTHNSVSGNGLTWSKIAELNGGTNVRASLWQAQGASPTSGSITVTLSGSPASAEAVATRFSGCDTTTPIEASQNTSGTSSTPSISITTLTANALAFGAFFDRSATFTVGTGETALSINNKTGTSGNTLNISTETQSVATAGSVTIDGAWSSSVNWALIAVSIKAAASGIVGTLTVTEQNDALVSTGALAITGALTRTEANDTLSSAGALNIVGSLNVTEQNDTLSASGGNFKIGSLNVTEANDTLSSTGNLLITGSLNQNEANDTLSSTGALSIVGSANITNANDTLSSSGKLSIVGNAVITESNDTLSSTGASSRTGSLNITESNDTLVATGKILILSPFARNIWMVDPENRNIAIVNNLTVVSVPTETRVLSA